MSTHSNMDASLSRDERSAVRRRFSHYITDCGSSEKEQLAEVRTALERDFGRPVELSEPLIRGAWDPHASSWDRFNYWASRFFYMPSFDADERDYKLAGATELQTARELILAGEPGWLEHLKGGFQPPMNLTNWRMYDVFFKWCEQAPDEATELLKRLWASEDPVEVRLGRFLETLSRDLASGPSTRIGFASQLLYAEDPFAYPFFRTTVFGKGYELTGVESPARDVGEVDRYLYAIAFADRIIEEARKRGLPLRDRLDAQSVLWVVIHWDRDDWPERELEHLQRYRDGLPVVSIEDDEVADTIEEEVSVPPTTFAALADDLMLDQRALENIRQLLEDKRQAIFYGPPGTGKTYIATRLAEFLTGDPSRVDLVQFHASYA